MKLSKIYSNQEKLFSPISFNDGLNVIIAEIKLPKNKDKDTHNLGKTTLTKLIDFCLLMGTDKEFFLIKQKEFLNFVFYLELALLNGSFLTIRRSVETPSKISFKNHFEPNQDFTNLPKDEWNHFEIAFDKSKELLDSLTDLKSLNPWSFRKGLGYLLRTQGDFDDVFNLKQFSAGKHSYWKPYLAHILGLNDSLVLEHYQKEDDLTEVISKINIRRAEIGNEMDDHGKIAGLLLIKREEVNEKQKELNAFDLGNSDRKETTILVDELDKNIAELNSDKYYLLKNLKRVEISLENNKILFNTEETKKLFEETGIHFPDSIEKSFDQLIAFNKAVTSERRVFLRKEKNEITSQLVILNGELTSLNSRRTKLLEYLIDSNVFQKYKLESEKLVTIKAEIVILEKQLKLSEEITRLQLKVLELKTELQSLKDKVVKNIRNSENDNNSLYSKIRIYFNQIVTEVISKNALLNVKLNAEDHLEFEAMFVSDVGKSTSESDGHTYKKFLCIAFDMAVLRAHLIHKYPRFVYHDGVFESLDDRKKGKLLEIIRKYCDLGIQQIITLIDSDLSDNLTFTNEEVILKLNDLGDQGRLFKMPSW